MEPMKYLFILTLAALTSQAQTKYITEWDFKHVTRDTVITVNSPNLYFIEVPQGKLYNIRITLEPVGNPLTSQVYDDSQMIYTGNWTNATNTCCVWNNNTLSYTISPGAAFTFTFTGEKLEWFAEQKNTHGFAKITIDGVVYPDVSLRSTRPVIPDVLAGIPSATWDLEPGQHTIRVEIKDNTGHLVHDFFRGWR
jgi:hypothetical protein